MFSFLKFKQMPMTGQYTDNEWKGLSLYYFWSV